jgi:hypothetical protein
MGDMFDFHGISYHEKEFEAPSISEEVQIAKTHASNWAKAFRKMKICIGNHDALIYRKAKTHGLSNSFLKTWNEIFDLPIDWVWNSKHVQNNCMFIHGTGFSGMYPHANAMRNHRRNVCIGHTHSVAGIHYSACTKDLLWGMAVGCGVDDRKDVFNYGKLNPKKSIISCGVILENGTIPLVKQMLL